MTKKLLSKSLAVVLGSAMIMSMTACSVRMENSPTPVENDTEDAITIDETAEENADAVNEEEAADETTDEASEEAADTEEAVEETTEEAGEDPVVFEDFEGDTNLAIERGEELTFTVVDDGVDGSKALKISDRTDTWNGANFDCNVFRGNTIRANASLKSAAKTVRISIQYDADGAPVYNWIASVAGKADEYVPVTGTFAIPDDVENIYVYVESDSCDDLYVDNFEVKAEGTYKAPGEIKEKVMADTSEYKSMKDVYKDYFDIGVCINPTTVTAPMYSKLILQQFSSVTCENDLKPESILNRSESLKDVENGGTHIVVDMSKAESELEFAKENGLKMRGHTLVWHSQTPDWIFYKNYDTKGELADRDLMLQRLDNYFNDVFTWADTNYPNLFYAWDVVNEAFEDNGDFRDSLWYQTIGEDYLEQVFATARKYAPDYIKLFYNDYNSYQASKQKGIIEALKPVAATGNIDGIGMQGHLYTGENPEHFAKCAKKYADELGVIIHVTEIDVSEPSSANPENDQGLYYGNLFKALKDAKTAGVPIESVTIWGLTDSLSWKAGEKPLIFNSDLTGKLAFYEIIEAAEK